MPQRHGGVIIGLSLESLQGLLRPIYVPRGPEKSATSRNTLKCRQIRRGPMENLCSMNLKRGTTPSGLAKINIP